MLKIILIYGLIYLCCVFFMFVSEITYKKKSLSAVLKDYKSIIIKCTLIFGVFVIASAVYHVMGIS